MDSTHIFSTVAELNPNCTRGDQSSQAGAEARAYTSTTDGSNCVARCRLSGTKGTYSGLEVCLDREPNFSLARHLTCHDFSSLLDIRSEVPYTNVESELQNFGVASRDPRNGTKCSQQKDPEIDFTSESGWTTYLKESFDTTTISHMWDGYCSSRANLAVYNEVAPAWTEDSSTASDASSGPEQPCFEHQCGAGVKTKCLGIKATACKRSLETADLNGIDGSDRFRWKRKRLQSCLPEAAELSGLEDTASSPLQGSLHDGDGETKRRMTSYPDRMNEVESILSRVSPEWGSHSVRQRLKTLEALVPNVKEVNEEDMLRITVDYVRALESKVKTLDKSSFRERDDPGAMSDKVGRKDSEARCSTLQDKGLCLVPISVVAKSL